MEGEKKEQKKPKKVYTIISRLIIAVIVFSIALEIIAGVITLVSSGADIRNIYKDQSTVVIVLSIMFLSALLMIVFERKADGQEGAFDDSGSGKTMKWLQVLHLWPELRIDKNGGDKNYKSFLKVSRFFWWASAIVTLLGAALLAGFYMFIRMP